MMRQLPGGQGDPTGLVDHAPYAVEDVYATEERSWVPSYPESLTSNLVNYEVLEGWLQEHLPLPMDIDVFAVFADTRARLPTLVPSSTLSDFGGTGSQGLARTLSAGMASLFRSMVTLGLLKSTARGGELL